MVPQLDRHVCHGVVKPAAKLKMQRSQAKKDAAEKKAAKKRLADERKAQREAKKQREENEDDMYQQDQEDVSTIDYVTTTDESDVHPTEMNVEEAEGKTDHPPGKNNRSPKDRAGQTGNNNT